MITTLVYFVIYVIIIGLIVGLLLWLIDYVGLPEPFNRIVRIAVVVVAVLIVIFLLLQIVGEGPPRLKLGMLLPYFDLG